MVEVIIVVQPGLSSYLPGGYGPVRATSASTLLPIIIMLVLVVSCSLVDLTARDTCGSCSLERRSSAQNERQDKQRRDHVYSWCNTMDIKKRNR